MKKVVPIIIMITMLIIMSSASSSENNNTITKEEILNLLIPEKHIEVDTIKGEGYIIRFMEGDEEKKRMELKMKYKEYKEEYLDTVIEHSARIGKKIYDIRTIHVNKDSIYETPDIYISPNRSKILIRWEEVIKRKIGKIEKIIELDTICYEVYHARGLRRVSRIELYDESGARLYKLRGEEIGWEQENRYIYDNIFGGYNKISDYKKFERISPFLYVLYVNNEGDVLITNNKIEGYIYKRYKILNREGRILLNERVLGVLDEEDIERIGKDMYVLLTRDSMELLKIDEKGEIKRVSAIEDYKKVSNRGTELISDNRGRINVIYEERDDVLSYGDKSKGVRVCIYDSELKLKDYYKKDYIKNRYEIIGIGKEIYIMYEMEKGGYNIELICDSVGLAIGEDIYKSIKGIRERGIKAIPSEIYERIKGAE